MPLSGPMADYGKKLKSYAEYAAEEINTAGGIKSLGGAKIELDFADTQSKPDVGQSQAERLILQDKVVGLIGSYNSGVTLTSTAVAEQNKIPYVVFSSVNNTITTRGFKYTFRPNETSTGITDTMFAFADGQIAKTGKKVNTYSIIYENTDFGKPLADEFTAKATTRGWTKLSADSYDSGVADITPIAIKVKDLKPDLIVTFSNQPDTNVVYQTLNQQAVKAQVMMDNSGTGQQEFAPLLAANADLLVETQWDASILVSRPWLAAHVDYLKQKSGAAILPEGLQAYSDVYLWADALERAASVDGTKLRDALAATNLTDASKSPALILPYATIHFGADGQNPDGALLLAQVSNGKLIPVFPDALRPSDYTPIWILK